ncbi:MAG: ATP-binding protein, partial [Pseudomonadota bacterium]
YITDVRPLEGVNGERLIYIAKTDVTELNAARKAAESADRMKSEFLATISHELRTPMNGVIGLAQILKETDLTEEQRRLVDTISSSGEGLLAVISDILDMTVIESGALRLADEPFEVEAMVDETVRMLTPAAEAAGLKLFISQGPGAPARGVGDVARLRQVLTNFIGNALKFTESGHVETRVDGSAADGTLRLSVIDTGIGLSKEDQAEVFDRFRQAKGGHDRPRQGVGLGLSICRSLAELMGGGVAVESAPGEGSAFSLTIPLNSGLWPGERRDAMGRATVIDAYEPRALALEERLSRWGWRRADGEPDVAVVCIDEPPDEDALRRALAPADPKTPVVVVYPLSHAGAAPTAPLGRPAPVAFAPAPAAGLDLRAALMRAREAAAVMGGKRLAS